MTTQDDNRPQDIADLTSTAIAHCESAAKAIRAVGAEALQRGEDLKKQCDRLALDFEDSSNVMADTVRAYAIDLRAQAQRVADIRKPNGNKSDQHSEIVGVMRGDADLLAMQDTANKYRKPDVQTEAVAAVEAALRGEQK